MNLPRSKCLISIQLNCLLIIRERKSDQTEAKLEVYQLSVWLNTLKQSWDFCSTLTFSYDLLQVYFLSQQSGLTDTYALEVCTSCQLLLSFWLSSLSGLRPSFLFSSAACLSLADNTWRRVLISSSTWNTTGTPQRVKSTDSPFIHGAQLFSFSSFIKVDLY